MFCYQCEQTSQGEGCQTLGVCGKDKTTAILQDLLIHVVKGISMYAHRARLSVAGKVIEAVTSQMAMNGRSLKSIVLICGFMN